MSGAARELIVRGTVQGVGFRPFVWRLATEEGLTGDVRNTGDGVRLRLWGTDAALDRFTARLSREAPPLAAIESIETAGLSGAPTSAAFLIGESEDGDPRAAITPDAAVCADCLRELRDPADRRYRYPFINCIQCGPRFSIVEGLPYDRPKTSMKAFAMCPACAREYHDPADRRFHAQPVACPACGPRLWLETADGAAAAEGEAALERTAKALREGAIVAIKGLGGFHLAVLATDAAAVARLRARKRRPAKPFALMVRDPGVADRFARLEETARAAISRVDAPIVLVPWRFELPGVAPGLDMVGLMLPYTPLHVLLLEGFDAPLVMTSANRTGEPQVTDLAAARARLGGIPDLYLTHDRPIANRVDDSLVRVADGTRQVLRRARGLAPRPLRLPEGCPEEHAPVLAMGGDIKNVFALARGGEVVLSQHIGDLENPVALRDLGRTIALMSELTGFAPARIACDPHPAYHSRRLALRLAGERGVPVDFVPHHHAHVAAAMAEHRLPLDHPPVLALALDGLGIGPDGTLWGCELLLADYREARRFGTLVPAPLPGGDRAAREPWRNLAARLGQAFGPPEAWPAMLAVRLADKPVETLIAGVAAGINAPHASSAGRLFDAVAAAAGVCVDRQDYEGEAAMRLQAAAGTAADAGVYPFVLRRGPHGVTLDPAPIWGEFAADLAAGASAAAVAAKFHAGLADGLGDMIAMVRGEAACEVVALTGGVFQNALLARLVRERLKADGLRVIEHHEVPANDGGLALGQAAIAIARTLGG